jgi:hypothetical protein
MIEMEKMSADALRCRTDHGATYELLLLALVLDLDDGLSTLVDDLVRPVLHVGLNIGIRELSSDESLGVEDGVVRVHGDLVLGGITDETLRVGETDVGGGGTVSLVLLAGRRKAMEGQRPILISRRR